MSVRSLSHQELPRRVYQDAACRYYNHKFKTRERVS